MTRDRASAMRSVFAKVATTSVICKTIFINLKTESDLGLKRDMINANVGEGLGLHDIGFADVWMR